MLKNVKKILSEWIGKIETIKEDQMEICEIKQKIWETITEKASSRLETTKKDSTFKLGKPEIIQLKEQREKNQLKKWIKLQ